MTVLICTTEGFGMDRYSREIARLLPIDVTYAQRYRLGLRAYALLRKLRAFKQVIHVSNQHFGRYAIFAGVPYVMTVHDLARVCFPFSSESPVEKMGLKLDALAIRRAEHIIAVSHNTKRDLVKNLGIAEDKITVIYNGVNHGVFKPCSSSPFPLPYILYVGSERPRKNLSRLLHAFASLKKSGEFSSLKLVKVGKAGRTAAFRKNTLQAVKHLELEGEVVFVEHITDEELSAYYSSALALVYPSLYEGFGLPVLEAMACSCPVVASNVSSLPEVAGDAALLINPYDVYGLSQAIRRVLTDSELRKLLTARGQERSRRFSWAETAAATLAVYRAVEAYTAEETTGHVQPWYGEGQILSESSRGEPAEELTSCQGMS